MAAATAVTRIHRVRHQCGSQTRSDLHKSATDDAGQGPRRGWRTEVSQYQGFETHTVLFDAPVPVNATGGAEGTGPPRFHLETARPLGTIRGTFGLRDGLFACSPVTVTSRLPQAKGGRH